MRRLVFAGAVAFLVAFVMGGAMAHAQWTSPQTVSAEVTFPFAAGGKEMAPGKYAIDVAGDFQLRLTGPAGDKILMPVVTLLGRHDKDADAEFVFDKVGGKTVLSEVWMPGRDGYLLAATKERHEHTVVGGSNPHK